MIVIITSVAHRHTRGMVWMHYKHELKILQQVLDKYIQDNRAKAVLSTLWPYLGLPPSRLSFLYWSSMLMSFLEEGVFYCQGTFQNLANALVEALTKKNNGRRRGEILLQSRVRRRE
jgi:all-trans-retinol 13,14-reductase